VNPDVEADIKELSATLSSIEAVLDLDALRAAVADLEAQATRPDLWDDQEKAQKVTSQLSHKQGELRRVTGLRSRLDDLPLLYELAEEAEDADAAADADNDRAKLREEIASLEVRTLLSGEYDERNALITIRAEAGGVDAADFAESTRAGPSATTTASTCSTRPTPKRPASSPPRSASAPRTPTAR
jgi:peptide chain release factor 2